MTGPKDAPDADTDPDLMPVEEFNEKRAFYFRKLAAAINAAHRDFDATPSFTLMVLIDVVSVIGAEWITNARDQEALPKHERLQASLQMLDRMGRFWQAECDGTTEHPHLGDKEQVH